jgi:hypothetical protein
VRVDNRLFQGISSTRASLKSVAAARNRKLSAEVRYNAHHLVALVHLTGDAAKERTTWSALVKCHVGIREALFDDFHDLGDYVANIGVLYSQH